MHKGILLFIITYLTWLVYMHQLLQRVTFQVLEIAAKVKLYI